MGFELPAFQECASIFAPGKENLMLMKKNLFYFQDDVDLVRHINPTTKEISFNAKYEQLFAPQVGFVIGKMDRIVNVT